MATIGSLVVNIIARTAPFARGMAQANTHTKAFTATTTRATSAMAGLGGVMVATAGVAGMASLIRANEQLNRSMNKSLSIMGDLSGEMRGNLRQAAIDVSRTTRFAATEAAEAYFYLASAGLDAEQSLAALPFTAKFAQAGFFDLSRATDLLTDAQSALGLTVKDATKNLENMKRVGDVLVKANTLANASVEQFSEALTTKAAAAARTTGIELEEVTAVLAALADQGLKGADAGTAFTIVLRELTNKAIINEEAFKDFGLEIFRADGSVRNLADIIGDLEKRFDGMSARVRTNTLLQLGFNQKSIASLKTLIGTSEAIRRYEAELLIAGGTTEKVSDNMTDLEKALAKLGAAWQSFAESAEPAVGVLAQITDNWAAMMEVVTGTQPTVPKLVGARETSAEQLARMQAELEIKESDRWKDIKIALRKTGAMLPEPPRLIEGRETSAEIQEKIVERVQALLAAAEQLRPVVGATAAEVARAAKEMDDFKEVIGGLSHLVKDPVLRKLRLQETEATAQLAAEAKELGLAEGATARQVVEARIAEERRAAALKLVPKIMEQTLTPLEIFKRDMESLDKVFQDTGRGTDKAGLSAEAYERRQLQLAEAFNKATPPAKKLTDLLNSIPGIVERNLTPMERFERDLLQLEEVFATSGLSREMFERESERLFGKPEKLPGAESPAALQRGSIAAFSASLKADRAAEQSEQKKQTSLLKKAVKSLDELVPVDRGHIA